MSNYEKVKEWRKNNPEKVLEQARRYRAKHPETNKKAKEKYRANNLEVCKLREREYQTARRKNDPEAQKIRNEHFKIRREAKMWDIAGRPRQDSCELCFDKVMTVFDHCHDGGHFRGWICDRCNRVLGSVKDDIHLLQAMIKYLENDRGREMDSKDKNEEGGIA